MKDCVVDGTAGAGEPPLFGTACAPPPPPPPPPPPAAPPPPATSTVTVRDAVPVLPAASLAEYETDWDPEFSRLMEPEDVTATEPSCESVADAPASEYVEELD